ncbi:MAG: rRNA maturation RNase YbeY [Chloroflexi bacterium]|nr:rRNA maturation RNase YbeY [Chloroflexota bacterium]
MSKIYLQIDEPYQPHVDREQLEAAVEEALRHQRAPQEASLSLRIASDEPVRVLNARYRGVDKATDVLSFPDGSPDPETGAPYLGDIIIAYPQAEAQAQKGGHPVMWELCLLTVHGVLHLLGHDHATEEEKARMWAAQKEILTRLGCPLDPP